MILVGYNKNSYGKNKPTVVLCEDLEKWAPRPHPAAGTGPESRRPEKWSGKDMSAGDIGIDLGTASVLVYVKGKGIVLCEPSVVAVDKSTGKILAIGEDAQKMLGRTPGNIIAVRPLRDGVISDYEMTEKMIKEFIHKVLGFRLFKPNVVICVPSIITEVEERAVIDAGTQAGARKVYLIEEPVAAAIGAGIEISKPDGLSLIHI